MAKKKHDYNPDLSRVNQSVLSGSMKTVLIVIVVVTFVGVFVFAKLLKHQGTLKSKSTATTQQVSLE